MVLEQQREDEIATKYLYFVVIQNTYAFHFCFVQLLCNESQWVIVYCRGGVGIKCEPFIRSLSISFAGQWSLQASKQAHQLQCK